MLDPQGLYWSAIKLYGLKDVPVIVPNVCDAEKITGPVPVMCSMKILLANLAAYIQLDFWS
jgi:hypothetical protein